VDDAMNGVPGARTGWRLAIDVGTSNTAAAVQVGAEAPRPVRLSDQADQMPSGVLNGPNGMIVGVEALRSARIDPSAFEPCPKRRVGEGQIQLGMTEVAVSAAIAAIMRHVFIRAARVTGGGHPQEVILTYPEQWQAPRRQVLIDAARAGGFPGPLRLVSEPVAAASHYATNVAVPPGALVAVFDFGGGTCDVAVLRAGAAAGPMPGGVHPWSRPPFTVLAAEGLDPLGGEDLDALLAQWTRQQLQDTGHAELVSALDAPAALADRLTFRDQVRAGKQALTDYESTRIPVAAGGDTAVVTITAAEFDTLIAGKIDAAVELTRRTLGRAGVTGANLHALYLTGGSAHLRLVQRRLTDLINRPPATLEDPKLVVALGALAVPATPMADVPPPIPQPPIPQPPIPQPPNPHAPVPQPPMPAPPIPTSGGPIPPQLPPNLPPPFPPQYPPQPGPPTPAPRWRLPLILGIAGLVVLLVLGAATALILKFNGNGAPNGSATTTPVVDTTTPSAGETTPTDDGSSGPPEACGTLSEAECTLANRLPTDFAEPGSCAHQDSPGADQVALLRCTVPVEKRSGANPGTEVFATRFASQAAMDAAIDTAASTFKVTATAQGCFDLKATGLSPWKRRDSASALGRLLCFTNATKSARLLWSYDGDLILMEAVGAQAEVPPLVQWWSSASMSAALR
jgi:hypothetical protein